MPLVYNAGAWLVYSRIGKRAGWNSDERARIGTATARRPELVGSAADRSIEKRANSAPNEPGVGRRRWRIRARNSLLLEPPLAPRRTPVDKPAPPGTHVSLVSFFHLLSLMVVRLNKRFAGPGTLTTRCVWSQAGSRERHPSVGRMRSCAATQIGTDPDAWCVAIAVARAATVRAGKRSRRNSGPMASASSPRQCSPPCRRALAGGAALAARR